MEPYPKVIINAAITGMIPTKNDTPHLPITEDEIVRDAVECHRAGAAIVHLHVRDEQGNPCYKSEKYGRIIRRIREKCNVIICVSTSGRFFKDFEHRSEVLFLKGIEKPEMASITTGSLNFPGHASVNPPDIIFRLAETMLDHGIKPEIEIFDSGMLNFARHLNKKLELPQPLYFNLIFGSLGGIPARIEDISYLINCLPEASLWSAAGIGIFQLPVNLTGLAAGGGVRVGLEDNIYFDFEKKELATNVQLIERIARMASVVRRELADADETRRMLCISPADYSREGSR
jgi:uncharacterized protein (DUF849 family)